MHKIILASQSPYRKELLQKLGFDFSCETSHIDEEAYKKNIEKPKQLAEDLAKAKALEVAQRFPNSFIIGSDQVIHFENKILSKPGNREKAVEQLNQANGKVIQLVNSMCLIDPQNNIEIYTDIARLKLFFLSKQEIEKYVDLDEPFQCAGSFMLEKNGVRLFESIEVNDHHSIIGLSLVYLNNYLRKRCKL